MVLFARRNRQQSLCGLYVPNPFRAFGAYLKAGDVTDEKFFKKRNDADTTQFAILFPRFATHGKVMIKASYAGC